MSGSVFGALVAPLAAKLVDWGQLLNVVEAALLAGVGITAVFALVIYGSTRAGDLRRRAQPVAAGLNAALAVVSLAGVLAAVAFAVSVMLDK